MSVQRPASPPASKAAPRRLEAILLPTLLALITPIGACDDAASDLVDADVYITANGEAVARQEPSNSSVGVGQPNNGPAEIYYDLTAFDWYRRGEPLVIDGREYRPDGIPEAERARKFEPVGEYMGVTYYVLENSSEPHLAVYIPVSPGYWQPFTPTPTTPELES